MSALASAELLRPGLLEGVSIMLAHTDADAPGESGAPAGARSPAQPGARAGSPLPQALADGSRALSARLSECPLPVDEESFASRLRQEGAPDMLVVDAAGVFAASPEPARDALGRTMQLTWEVTRAVAAALIEERRPGRIVLVAPPASSDSPGEPPTEEQSHARATRAGLENLARTLSIEWSRYPITTVTLAPGPDTAGETLASLCAYLASPAGSYFSGCVLGMAGPNAAAGDRP